MKKKTFHANKMFVICDQSCLLFYLINISSEKYFPTIIDVHISISRIKWWWDIKEITRIWNIRDVTVWSKYQKQNYNWTIWLLLITHNKQLHIKVKHYIIHTKWMKSAIEPFDKKKPLHSFQLLSLRFYFSFYFYFFVFFGRWFDFCFYSTTSFTISFRLFHLLFLVLYAITLIVFKCLWTQNDLAV